MYTVSGPVKTYVPPQAVDLVYSVVPAVGYKSQPGRMVASIAIKTSDGKDEEIRFGYTANGDIFNGISYRDSYPLTPTTLVLDVAYNRPGLKVTAYMNLFNFDFCEDVHTEMNIREQIMAAFEEVDKEIVVFDAHSV